MSPNIWFIATNLGADEWYQRVRTVLNPADDIAVATVDLKNAHGWVSNTIVEYIARDHDSRPGH